MGTRHTLMPLWVVSRGLEPVKSGLVAEYRFDEGSGQVLTDYSGNGYHLQLGSTSGSDTNDPAWTSEGQTFITDDYDTDATPPAALLPDIWTVMCVTSHTTNAHSPLWTFNSGSDFGIHAQRSTLNTLLYLWPGSQNQRRFTVSGTTNDGVYKCLTFQIPGTAQADIASSKAYENKVELSVASTNTIGTQSTKDLMLLGASNASFLDGKIAFFLLYNRMLTEAEIFQNYEYIKVAVASRGISLP